LPCTSVSRLVAPVPADVSATRLSVEVLGAEGTKLGAMLCGATIFD